MALQLLMPVMFVSLSLSLSVIVYHYFSIYLSIYLSTVDLSVSLSVSPCLPFLSYPIYLVHHAKSELKGAHIACAKYNIMHFTACMQKVEQRACVLHLHTKYKFTSICFGNKTNLMSSVRNSLQVTPTISVGRW